MDLVFFFLHVSKTPGDSLGLRQLAKADQKPKLIPTVEW